MRIVHWLETQLILMLEKKNSTEERVVEQNQRDYDFQSRIVQVIVIVVGLQVAWNWKMVRRGFSL
jgi:hypothetical protein